MTQKYKKKAIWLGYIYSVSWFLVFERSVSMSISIDLVIVEEEEDEDELELLEGK